jgi:ribosomal protein S12 methylthiotransferase
MTAKRPARVGDVPKAASGPGGPPSGGGGRTAPGRGSPRVALVSLGCPKNLVDGEVMLGLLAEAGWRVTDDPGRADLVIVNTCAFIDEARQESVEAILDVADGRPVVVAGCLAQRYPRELMREIPEISAVVGTGDVERIVEVARRALAGERVEAVGHAAARYDRLLPRRRLEPGPSAYLKIAEGCDRGCRFCAIPSFRGRFRSRPPEVLVAEAEALAAEGVRELVLVSQDSVAYGKDLPGRPWLGSLLEALSGVEGICWIRVLYLYPYQVDDRLIAAFAETPKVLPYFDIPLQHGHDAVLAAMGRPDRRDGILRLVERIRHRIPHAVLRSSFIVGYPGEGDANFRALLDLLAEVEFDHAGFFVFSPEEGTPAARLPDHVPAEVAHARYHEAMAFQARIASRRNAARVGAVVDVLVERPVSGDPRYAEGRWWGQAPEVDGQVIVAGDAAPGHIVPVRIERAEDFDLHGSVAAAGS